MTFVSGVEIAYLASGVLLPVFYLPQILKLWRDKTRLGSYSLSKATAQLVLRLPVLVFAVVVVKHDYMTMVVTGDVLGRVVELAVALRALRHQGVPADEVAARMSPTHAIAVAVAEVGQESSSMEHQEASP